jgi:hypothetical protein
MNAKIRMNVVVATCCFVYTFIAAAMLILSTVIGSQGNSGNLSIFLIFAIVLTSPLPMLLVGWLFLRRRAWAAALTVVLALAQALATATQWRIASHGPIGALDAAQAALFYVCFAQTVYLPGSVALVVLSPLAFLRGSDPRVSEHS